MLLCDQFHEEPCKEVARMTTEIDLSKAKKGDKFITRDGIVVVFENFGRHATHKFIFGTLDGDNYTPSRHSMSVSGKNLCSVDRDIVAVYSESPDQKCPTHYGNSWEVGDFIRSQSLSFHLGNAIKYVCRAGKKGSKIDDLKKAIHYLTNELEHEQARQSSKGVSADFPGPEYFEWASQPDT